MSKTFKIEKPAGVECWTRRPSKGCITPNKKSKQLTHRLERRHAARGIQAEVSTADCAD